MIMVDAEVPHYWRIKHVHSMDELLDTPWVDGVNALCFERTLAGDYAEVARLLEVEEGITTLEPDELHQLALSQSGRAAVTQMLADFTLLIERGLAPELNCVNGFLRDSVNAVVRTDVSSFHVDSATSAVDTLLCTYYGASSEGLPNEQATLKVLVPSIRQQLLSEFGGPEGPAFERYLRQHCYDLHYLPHEGAEVFQFGVGNLWRVAVKHRRCPVPPCIHRAPDTLPGQRRLLLIS
jgi:hypothetical protein